MSAAHLMPALQASLGLGAGLGAGVLHVLTGPDHLAALAPLSLTRGSARPRQSWRIGAAWGLGHALGSGLLVAAALVLRQVLPVEHFASFSATAEHLVGYLLLGLGGWGLWQAARLRLHVHEHAHDGRVHRHLHVHGAGRAAHGGSSQPDQLHANHWHLPVGIGCLHGLAGAGALLWLLPGLGMATGPMVAYLVGFGIAGVVAMAAVTRLLAGVGRLRVLQRRGYYNGLLAAVSLVTLGVGGVWLAG